MKNLALMGRAGAGKDTLAAMLCERDGYVRVAFADALKAMALAVDPLIPMGIGEPTYNARLSTIVTVDGWDAAKRDYPEVRRFLQRLGKEGVRDIIGPTTWISIAAREIDKARSEGRPVVVTDVRFDNELRTLYLRGFRSVYITRPGISDGDHASESELAATRADLVINNDGPPEDMYAVARKFASRDV